MPAFFKFPRQRPLIYRHAFPQVPHLSTSSTKVKSKPCSPTPSLLFLLPFSLSLLLRILLLFPRVSSSAQRQLSVARVARPCKFITLFIPNTRAYEMCFCSADACVCSDTKFQEASRQCLQSKCSASDQAAALTLQKAVCGTFNASFFDEVVSSFVDVFGNRWSICSGCLGDWQCRFRIKQR
jgi:hypothetical protein